MTTSVKLVTLVIAADMDIFLLLTRFLTARDVDRQALAVPLTALPGFPNNYLPLPRTILKYVYAVMNLLAVMMSPSKSLNFTFNRVLPVSTSLLPGSIAHFYCLYSCDSIVRPLYV